MSDSDVMVSDGDASDYFSPVAVRSVTLNVSLQILNCTETQGEASRLEGSTKEVSRSQEGCCLEGSTQENVPNNAQANEETTKAKFR